MHCWRGLIWIKKGREGWDELGKRGGFLWIGSIRLLQREMRSGKIKNPV